MSDIRYIKGLICIYTLIDGHFYSVNRFREFEYMAAYSYIKTLEKWGNEYIKAHPRSHYGIITLSKKYGIDTVSIAFEDIVDPKAEKRYDNLIDELYAGAGVIKK